VASHFHFKGYSALLCSPEAMTMTPDGFKRKLAAILSADVKDYSRLMRDDEAVTVKTLNAYREVMTRLILQHHGRVVDSPGDNLLAEFNSVVDGVQAAVAIQKELKARNAKLPAGRKMVFRIGINLGDIIEEEGRIYGDGVNLAARLEALAEPGGICISRTAFDQIEDKLPFGYKYLGEKTAKNMPKPIRVYKVVFEPENFTKKLVGQISALTRKDKGHDWMESGLPESKSEKSPVSDKKRLLATILCSAFGIFGAHRFYVGKTKTAKLMLFTIGGLGIWYVVDFLIVLFGEFTDKEGRKIKQWV
jgi:class 3 adenylate cyclase